MIFLHLIQDLKYTFTNDYNVTVSSCFVREKIKIHECKGTVQLSELTIYPTYYVDLLRCKAHVSAIDGDIKANFCFITRALAPYISGNHNVYSDTTIDDVFIPTAEQDLVNTSTTLGEINLYEKYYVKSISCPNLVSCDVINITQRDSPRCLLELNLPVLTTAIDLGIANTRLSTLALSALTSVEIFGVSYNNLLSTLDLSSLTSVGDRFIISYNNLLSTLDLSSLTSVGDIFVISIIIYFPH